MPFGRPEIDDPEMLVGVAVPADPASAREMAYVFAEEFATLGYGAERILRIFRNPHYLGPHRALELLGEDEVRRIVGECVAFWGHGRIVTRDRVAWRRDR
ncbi:MAG: hypothetical protein KatS3mg076_0409 [Candidatus Binatia bacterium]|nr:MAG: hypothetical protein KatS3mg076_0409 [Candidatus Binatia bacterium]